MDVVLSDSSDIVLGYISNEDLISVSQGITHDLTKEGGLYDKENINAMLRGAIILPLTFTAATMAGFTVCGASLFLCPGAIAALTFAVDNYVSQASSTSFEDLEYASEFFTRLVKVTIIITIRIYM